MRGTKPRIFVSSTIYDFRDLRSALKYWLEQFGYEVCLSEFNDFTKRLDENAYNASLRAIEQSDYYVLFIGARVGGLYSTQGERVSITRMEYRTAYELVKGDRLKPVVFVRHDLWTAREDRKGLRDVLERDFATAKELLRSDIDAITNHRSTIANDAEAIFGFIEEVRHAQENKEAINGERPFPKGNWVHVYSTFEDVVEVLRSELGIVHSLSKIALRANLKHELYANLILLTERRDGKIIPTYRWASSARQYLTGDYCGTTRMPAQVLSPLGLYAVLRAGEDRCSTHFINQALLSGEFLEYDVRSSTYRNGPITDALFDLRDHIERLRYRGQEIRDMLVRFGLKYRHLTNSEEVVSIPNSDLLAPLAVADCQQNIIALTVALIKALDGSPQALARVKLNPTSPLASEAEQLKNHTASPDEIAKWVSEQG
jgi:hypothetical protein